MKNIGMYIALALLLVGLSANSFAQASVNATASTTANIVAPIGIGNAVDMNFGNVAKGIADGTVILSPAGGRTVTGGVTLPPTVGTFTAASFHVTGEGTYSYAITITPSSITLSDGASHTVSVGTFNSTPSGTGVLTSGAQTVNVGATLTIPAATVAGTYTNASDLTVTVHYN